MRRKIVVSFGEKEYVFECTDLLLQKIKDYYLLDENQVLSDELVKEFLLIKLQTAKEF